MAAPISRFAVAALLAGAAAPGAAQRLPYEDVFAPPGASGAPELGDQVDADVGAVLAVPATAPAAAASATADAETDGGTSPVREYYFDRMEVGAQRGADGYAWDIAARIGGRRHRVWLEAIGEGTLGGSLDYLELQALYSRPISSGWDVQAACATTFARIRTAPG
ncbi:MAG: copper resistance protein [Sphingomonadales bacterium]|jgi:copper resistance protein B|nr:copper resistance protein [Sphingomonadales bacterium]